MIDRTCGSELTAEQVAHMEADFAAKKVAAPEMSVASATIPVYFHVIQEDSTLSGGNVPYVSSSNYRYLSYST